MNHLVDLPAGTRQLNLIASSFLHARLHHAYADFRCRWDNRPLVKKSWVLPKNYMIPDMANTEIFYYECPLCCFTYSVREIEGD